ncbi:MAG TPA: ABC transporter permease [Chloroflexota bacterium]|jgi:ribose/xylose/arabinose/galactoside ABC-type transport system permease subunit
MSDSSLAEPGTPPAEPGVPAAPAGRLRSLGIPLALVRIGGLLAAIVLIMIVFQLQNSYFLTKDNMLELIRSMSTLGIVALGETLVIIAGEIDLSVGAVYGFCAMALGEMWMHGLSLWVALPAALLIGALLGLVNAFFTEIVGIPSFIATLGMFSLAQGLTYLISNSQSINPQFGTPPVDAGQFSFFHGLSGSQLPFNIPTQILWLVIAAVVIGLLLHRSLFGFRLTAIGGNPEAARLIGLPVRSYKFWVFAISGLCAAVGGILDFSFISSTSPNAGINNITFPTFAAVIIGGASLSGGRGTVVGTLAGALLLGTMANGLNLNLVDPFVQLVAVGIVTIAAVSLDRWAGLFGARARRRR